MAVTRTLPAAAALCAVGALLAACGSPLKVEQPKAEPTAAPRPAPYERVDPELPVLPPAGSGRGGYYQDDGPGEDPPPNLRNVPDAVVRAEPYSRYANRPYTVFGKTYTPFVHDKPFVQRGVSSWYGKKFHGQRTSSGEIYDMYKMTAAHPTLPIPSYARITSLDTGKQVVVRINDRGPFHSSRVVDVSYTAALKLGLLGKGSQRVEVERLLPNAQQKVEAIDARRAEAAGASLPEETGAVVTMAVDMPPPNALMEVAAPVTAPASSQAPAPASSQAPSLSQAPAASAGFYLQFGAFSRADKAAEVLARLTALPDGPGLLEIVQNGALHRIFSGPFPTRADAMLAMRGVPSALGLNPIVVRRD